MHSRYSQFGAVNPRCHKVKSSRVKPPRARESIFSPGGGSQPPSCLPWSRSPSASQPLRSLCLRSFTPYSIQALRVEGSRGRPGDSWQPLQEPLRVPAAVPEPSPLPRLPPRRFTLRAAPGWEAPAARWAPPYRREPRCTPPPPSPLEVAPPRLPGRILTAIFTRC